MKKRNNKIIWLLSIIVVISMLCSLIATMNFGSKTEPTTTPTLVLLYPTSRP